MAVSEDVAWLVRDLHYSRVRSGYYQDIARQVQGLFCDEAAWRVVAKQVGCSPAVLDAIVLGSVEPTVAQFRQLNEALRTAVAVAQPVPEPALNGAAS